MKKRSDKEAVNDPLAPETGERDVFDESMFDVVLYEDEDSEEYPDLQYAAVSESSSAKG